MCNQNNIRLVIETEEDGPVGLAVIVNIDWKNRVGTYGIKIGNKSFRAKGIGTDATMTINRYAFDELQLNRIESDFIDYNEVSKGLYFNKLG
ncbi:MAG: GNAT family N-acetyltransferase [Clostridiaceae bacterium]|nr:GNAT family N-acetyltransferase [Clostridiaceae bacterium]